MDRRADDGAFWGLADLLTRAHVDGGAGRLALGRRADRLAHFIALLASASPAALRVAIRSLLVASLPTVISETSTSVTASICAALSRRVARRLGEAAPTTDHLPCAIRRKETRDQLDPFVGVQRGWLRALGSLPQRPQRGAPYRGAQAEHRQENYAHHDYAMLR